MVNAGGRYLDDITLPGMLHAAFLRAPYGHARFRVSDTSAAKHAPGVVEVFTAEDIARVASEWSGNSPRYPTLNSPVQCALAAGRSVYQGEPVAMVVARSRALAEDALDRIEIDWEELPVCADLAGAASNDAALVHPQLRSNVAFEHRIDSGDVEKAFREAAHVVNGRFTFGRHTGSPLETRGVVAQFEPGSGELTVWQSTQVPNQSKAYLAQILGVASHKVRVIVPDVGGGFGIKMHLYPDEVAACAAALLLGAPVKYVCDRMEALATDAQAREHIISARMAVDEAGRITAFDIDDLFGVGAYSMAPRTGVMEPMGVLRLIGAPYRFVSYRARLQACFLNKAPAAQYRAVGHPIAVAVTERLIDKAAMLTGIDPLELRALNYLQPGNERVVTPAGATVFDMSHDRCRETLLGMMDIDVLRAERDGLRKKGVYRGIGFAAYVEMTATGPAQYGAMNVSVTAMDTAWVELDASGGLNCNTSIVEIGQGSVDTLGQIVADAVGVDPAMVTVRSGDTATSGYGGGVWASRGIAVGGEAMWKAGRRLRENIISAAGFLLQQAPEALDIRNGAIVNVADGAQRMALAELAHSVYHRGEFTEGPMPQLAATEQYRRERDLFLPTNGIQASYVEVDVETGVVRLLKHWIVDDCGTVINPLLLDEQVRGGAVQGFGAALYEHCNYDESGQLLSGSFADYRLPLASEMPDIEIGHVATPYGGSELGAKGGGEAGTCAAAAAVLNAVNDALSSLDAEISELPITPKTVLAALHDGPSA